MEKLVLVAVGGNALIGPGQEGTADEQFTNAMHTADAIVQLIKSGYRVVVTHGNGPQVGAALARSEVAAETVYRMPYDCCVAATQGEIGYVLQYAMWQMMQREHLDVPVVTLVTQVIVDPRDPGFQQPTKPIGPFYSRATAERYNRELGWEFRENSRGWRRVVPSPVPERIVELEAIRACVDKGLVVIAAGGGGVPVFNDHDITKGVEAVIDKDLTSALLASELHANALVMATGEPYVFLDYGKPSQRAARTLTYTECKSYSAEGQFPEGSMGPKIRAALFFLERGGHEAIVTDNIHLHEALEGKAGTHIQSLDELVDWP